VLVNKFIAMIILPIVQAESSQSHGIWSREAQATRMWGKWNSMEARRAQRYFERHTANRSVRSFAKSPKDF